MKTDSEIPGHNGFLGKHTKSNSTVVFNMVVFNLPLHPSAEMSTKTKLATHSNPHPNPNLSPGMFMIHLFTRPRRDRGVARLYQDDNQGQLDHMVNEKRASFCEWGNFDNVSAFLRGIISCRLKQSQGVLAS